jgi:hypothetical protein
MKLRVQISAKVADGRETVVGVRRFKKSGQDYATSRDAVENQRIDVIGAKDHREIGAGEGTDPVLGELLHSRAVRQQPGSLQAVPEIAGDAAPKT